jgi:hypothetical protein
MREWVTSSDDYIQLDYPGNSTWGASWVYVTPDGTMPTFQSDRYYVDVSAYSTMIVEMRGEVGGETVEIGLKDVADPDTGTETKYSRVLSTEFEQYSFDLSHFYSADLTKLFIPIEFVFASQATTIYVKNVTYKL